MCERTHHHHPHHFESFASEPHSFSSTPLDLPPPSPVNPPPSCPQHQQQQPSPAAAPKAPQPPAPSDKPESAVRPAAAAAAAAPLAAPPVGPGPAVWIPISGPPTDATPEMRQMQHPADVKEVAPTSIVEVATPQQLAIGKREAREQAVALASASAEIVQWKGRAAEAEKAAKILVARTRELEVQRNEVGAVSQPLVLCTTHLCTPSVSQLVMWIQPAAASHHPSPQYPSPTHRPWPSTRTS